MTQYLEFSLSNEVLLHLTECAADGQTSLHRVVDHCQHSLRLQKYVLDANSNNLVSIALHVYLVVETWGTDVDTVERAGH